VLSDLTAFVRDHQPRPTRRRRQRTGFLGLSRNRRLPRAGSRLSDGSPNWMLRRIFCDSSFAAPGT